MTLVLAVDGGNSKTDVALVAGDGRLLATVHGPTSSHQAVGIEAGMERLAALIAEAHAQAGAAVADRADVGVYCLAGADTADDVRLLTGATGRSRVRQDRPACATTRSLHCAPARTGAGASS